MTAAVLQHPLGLTVRPIAGPHEVELFNAFPYPFNDEIAQDLATGHREPGWLWVALRHGRVVARAGWWSRPGGQRPLLFDIFDAAGHEAAARALLRTALDALVPAGAKPPQYLRLLPGTWREDPELRPRVESLAALVEGQGAEPFVERLRFQWDPGTPVTAPDGRLSFRPVAGHGELVGLMTEVLDGTLDAHSRRDLRTMPPEQVAREHYDHEMAGYTTPRDWWRVGVLPGGEPVGFVIAARNDYNAIIAYIAVRPAHRGRGHIDALLAEGTRVLAAEGVPSVRATTDVGNTPMAAAFVRAGYVAFEREIHYHWT